MDDDCVVDGDGDVVDGGGGGEDNVWSVGLMAVGLMEMAAEVVHEIALSGWLEFEDVEALGLTCKKMAGILVWDGYGRDLHYALLGVGENARRKRWKAGKYALKRRWFGKGDGENGRKAWKQVAEIGLDDDVVLGGMEEWKEWENLLLTSLSLPITSGDVDGWAYDKEDGGRTSLLHVAAATGSEKVIKWMVERGGGDLGGDLETRNEYGETPLLVACESGKVEVVDMLVEHGADLEATNQYGEGVLHIAIQNGWPDVVSHLLELRVPVDEGNHYHARDEKRNSLGFAVECGHLDVVKVLVEEGGCSVDVEGRMWEGINPLFRACLFGHVDVAEYLVEMGGWSHIPKNRRIWVEGLVAAAGKGHVDVVRMLIRVGVAVDELNRRGITPLIAASREGRIEVVRVLIEEGGADVNGKGMGGDNGLAVARREGRGGVVDVLVSAGAVE